MRRRAFSGSRALPLLGLVAFASCAENLPAPAWQKAARQAQLPAEHPLPASPDIPAAASQLWAGYSGLQHGLVAAANITALTTSECVLLLQPDYDK